MPIELIEVLTSDPQEIYAVLKRGNLEEMKAVKTRLGDMLDIAGATINQWQDEGKEVREYQREWGKLFTAFSHLALKVSDAEWKAGHS